MPEKRKERPLPPKEEIPLERMPWVVVEVSKTVTAFAAEADRRGVRMKGGSAKQIKGMQTFLYNDIYEDMSKEGFTDGQIRTIAEYMFEAIMLTGPIGGASN